MSCKYNQGELFVYTNGDRWELGMVKRPNGRGDGYFCWYSRGDTAANTPTSCMHKLSNAGFTHIEHMLDAATVGVGTCHTVYLVEVSDDLIESWHPIGVYLHRESAEDCAKALRREDDGVRQFARVVELGMEGAGTCTYVPDETGFTWWDENDVEHYEEYSASDECGSASCDKCGYSMMVGEEGWFDGWDEITEWWEEDGSYHKGYVLKPRFKHCPNCGGRL